MPFKKLAAATLLALFLILSLLLLLNLGALFAHAAVSSRPPNAFGAIISDVNPNVYTIGQIVDGSIHECDKDEWCTTLSIREFKTALLIPAPTITLCGDEGDEVTSAMHLSPLLAFTYRRQGTRIYGGIVCHDLVSVIPIKGIQ